MSQKWSGIILVILSATAFSTTGIFTKGVDADAWSVLFWRCLSGGVLALVYLMIRRQLRQEWAKWDFASLQALLCMTVGTIMLMNAYKMTSVANVSVIWALAPFFTAFLGWILLGEKPTLPVLVCSGIAVFGAVLVVGGWTVSAQFTGEVLTLLMNLCMALLIIIYRRSPGISATMPAIASSLLVALIMLAWAKPFENTLQKILILIGSSFAYVLALVTMLDSVVTRYFNTGFCPKSPSTRKKSAVILDVLQAILTQ